jgi:hypothetical protein
MNAHLRVTLAKKECNNQVDRTTHLWIPISLLPSHPWAAQWGYEKSSYGGRDRIMCGLRNITWTSIHKANPATATFQFPFYQHGIPEMAPFPASYLLAS